MSPQTFFTVAGFHSLALFFPVAIAAAWLRPRIWLHLFITFLGIFTGLIAVRSDDPQLPVLLWLVFGFFAGFARPRQAWIFGILLAVWTPLTLIAALLFQAVRGQPWLVPGSCLAFLPSLAGVGIGVLARRSAPDRLEPAEI